MLAGNDAIRTDATAKLANNRAGINLCYTYSNDVCCIYYTTGNYCLSSSSAVKCMFIAVWPDKYYFVKFAAGC
jgi:hypothetical protein